MKECCVLLFLKINPRYSWCNNSHTRVRVTGCFCKTTMWAGWDPPYLGIWKYEIITVKQRWVSKGRALKTRNWILTPIPYWAKPGAAGTAARRVHGARQLTCCWCKAECVQARRAPRPRPGWCSDSSTGLTVTGPHQPWDIHTPAGQDPKQHSNCHCFQEVCRT